MEDSISEIYVAIRELRAMQSNLTLRIKELQLKASRASEEQHAFEQRRVIAAGRLQWSDAIAIPNQPALEGQAYLAIDTRKCSACGQRQSHNLIDGRLSAKYGGVPLPYEYTLCQGCKAIFI